jgi:hypothetical protein
MKGHEPLNGDKEPLWHLLVIIIAKLVCTFFVGYAFGKVL